MILTKLQLIKYLLKGNIFNEKVFKNVYSAYKKMREDLFIKMIKKELNISLEPIRKNLYIVH